MKQKIITNYTELDEWVNSKKRVFLVCDASLQFLSIKEYFDNRKEKFIRFDDFQSNPLYESVVKGVQKYRNNNCDAIIAIGGGSAIDVAKCIKAYTTMNGDGKEGAYLKQEINENGIPFLVIPTTAGTGSEATRYAVIYYNGTKQSVTSVNFIPETVLMDPSVLTTLPIYQKKATMCDALCHAIESYWSLNSTEVSKEYSKDAIQTIIANIDGYLSNTEEGRAKMLYAANIAGKAINITQTTAGHAMCYKITSIYGIAHGHAAILCDRVLFQWMIENTDKCLDPRGKDYLKKTLDEIGIAMGCENAIEGSKKLVEIFNSLELEIPKATVEQYEELKTSVNPVRLKNHPIKLNLNTIDALYHLIMR